ncbi:hypothetical protein ACO0K7_08570 [Undibacterium sp. Ji67W]|uniref:hypothetical protein n=1 Tax=Undibacterium sp. Ji67W TaxID=3413042 RepID=UPI003BF2C984
MYLQKIFVFLLVTLIPFFAAAERFDSQNKFVITGAITIKSVDDFDQALKSSSQLDGILLSNSFGATDNGVEIVKEFKKRIDERKLNTYMKGYCASACANIFLLGYKRVMLANPSGKPSMLLLHPVRKVSPENINGVGQIQVFFTDKINQEISDRSEGKITIDLLNRMYDADDGSGGIFILRDANSEGKYVLFSKSIAKRIRATPISQSTPEDLGIMIAE